MLSDEHLDWILGELRAMPHVQVIRIGSRMPVVLPYRSTASLVSVLAFLLIKVNQGRRGEARRIPFPRVPNRLFKGVIYGTSTATMAFILFPVYWMILMAFRPQSLNFSIPPVLYPTTVVTDGRPSSSARRTPTWAEPRSCD